MELKVKLPQQSFTTLPRELQLLVLQHLQAIDPISKNAFSSKKITGNAGLFLVSKQMNELAACASLDLIRTKAKAKKLSCDRTDYLLQNAGRFQILKLLGSLLVSQIKFHISSDKLNPDDLDRYAVHANSDIKKAAIRQIILGIYRRGAGISHLKHEVPEVREAARKYLELE